MDNQDLQLYQKIEGTIGKFTTFNREVAENDYENFTINKMIELLQRFERLTTGQNAFCKLVVTKNGRVVVAKKRPIED